MNAIIRFYFLLLAVLVPAAHADSALERAIAEKTGLAPAVVHQAVVAHDRAATFKLLSYRIHTGLEVAEDYYHAEISRAERRCAKMSVDRKACARDSSLPFVLELARVKIIAQKNYAASSLDEKIYLAAIVYAHHVGREIFAPAYLKLGRRCGLPGEKLLAAGCQTEITGLAKARRLILSLVDIARERALDREQVAFLGDLK